VPNSSGCRLFSLVLEWGINHVISFSTPTPAGPATSNALRATPPSSTPTPRPSATPIVIDRATRPSLHRPSPHSVRRSRRNPERARHRRVASPQAAARGFHTTTAHRCDTTLAYIPRTPYPTSLYLPCRLRLLLRARRRRCASVASLSGRLWRGQTPRRRM
jgi:hypothetical protein